jgi:hypothetical protein
MLDVDAPHAEVVLSPSVHLFVGAVVFSARDKLQDLCFEIHLNVYKLDNFGPAGGTGYLSHNSELRGRWCSRAWASISETEKGRLVVAAFMRFVPDEEGENCFLSPYY